MKNVPFQASWMLLLMILGVTSCQEEKLIQPNANHLQSTLEKSPSVGELHNDACIWFIENHEQDYDLLRQTSLQAATDFLKDKLGGYLGVSTKSIPSMLDSRGNIKTSVLTVSSVESRYQVSNVVATELYDLLSGFKNGAFVSLTDAQSEIERFASFYQSTPDYPNQRVDGALSILSSSSILWHSGSGGVQAVPCWKQAAYEDAEAYVDDERCGNIPPALNARTVCAVIYSVAYYKENC